MIKKYQKFGNLKDLKFSNISKILQIDLNIKNFPIRKISPK